MAHFCYRLIAPRPTFPADMTAAEGEAMQRHFAYWTGQAEAGAAIVVGPVMAPEGAFGLAILEAADAAAAAAIAAGDPLLLAELGFSHRIDPMPSVIRRGKA